MNTQSKVRSLFFSLILKGGWIDTGMGCERMLSVVEIAPISVMSS